ncbi:PTS mannose transporter subunit IIA [Marinilactibacillus psychrotolerans]|uniref:PTS mannose transporter subunit IIA n=1 Tax=Marinilactibacillus psychrotolerans TaxID=191770 RepID=A0A5R9C2I0_9LACT|nr:PTS mannose transporter subunit IIA [Marinilactibacillus psychrotolerans]TLQ06941.1 PTS mannose transporter subunit IIA [Marinilactibacillus psychrotolerans]
MTKKIILASHGRFASGILSSLQLICGDNQNIIALDCYTNESFDLTTEVEKLMKQFTEEEIVVVTDIFGGSVNNEFLRYITKPNYYLVAGLNLPFLIELTTKLSSASLEVVIQQSLNNSKNSIQFCNKIIEKEVEEEEF